MSMDSRFFEKKVERGGEMMVVGQCAEKVDQVLKSKN